MQPWQLSVLAVAALFAVYFIVGMGAGLRRRRFGHVLARERGSGSFATFASRVPRAHLTDKQLEAIYTFLRAHGAPGFDIFPSDSLRREFGIGDRHGVPVGEFVDDLRALLNLPRGRRAAPLKLQTVGELVAMLDDEVAWPLGGSGREAVPRGELPGPRR